MKLGMLPLLRPNPRGRTRFSKYVDSVASRISQKPVSLPAKNEDLLEYLNL
jgi:hypothetical protein